MKSLHKIRSNRMQYGYIGCIIRMFHFIFRQVGVVWERFYYLEKELTLNDAEAACNTNYTIQVLTFDDFQKGDISYFTKAKLINIKKQLLDKTYIPYGIIKNKKLAYSAWISLKTLPLPYGFELNLKENEGALFDDYCAPEFRNQGMHSAVLRHRLGQLYRYGKNKGVVVILTGNRPALKAETKDGFKTTKKLTILKIFDNKTMIWK